MALMGVDFFEFVPFIQHKSKALFFTSARLNADDMSRLMLQLLNWGYRNFIMPHQNVNPLLHKSCLLSELNLVYQLLSIELASSKSKNNLIFFSVTPDHVLQFIG
jgi:hypothetical protein